MKRYFLMAFISSISGFFSASGQEGGQNQQDIHADHAELDLSHLEGQGIKEEGGNDVQNDHQEGYENPHNQQQYMTLEELGQGGPQQGGHHFSPPESSVEPSQTVESAQTYNEQQYPMPQPPMEMMGIQSHRQVINEPMQQAVPVSEGGVMNQGASEGQYPHAMTEGYENPDYMIVPGQDGEGSKEMGMPIQGQMVDEEYGHSSVNEHNHVHEDQGYLEDLSSQEMERVPQMEGQPEELPQGTIEEPHDMSFWPAEPENLEAMQQGRHAGNEDMPDDTEMQPMIAEEGQTHPLPQSQMPPEMPEMMYQGPHPMADEVMDPKGTSDTPDENIDSQESIQTDHSQEGQKEHEGPQKEDFAQFIKGYKGTMPIALLLPSQHTFSQHAVDMKVNKAEKNGQIRFHTLKNGGHTISAPSEIVHVVKVKGRGDANQFLIIEGIHTVLANHQAGADHIYVDVIDDLSQMLFDQAIQTLEKQGRIYLGEGQQLMSLPESLDQLKEDPIRDMLSSKIVFWKDEKGMIQIHAQADSPQDPIWWIKDKTKPDSLLGEIKFAHKLNQEGFKVLKDGDHEKNLKEFVGILKKKNIEKGLNWFHIPQAETKEKFIEMTVKFISASTKENPAKIKEKLVKALGHEQKVLLSSPQKNMTPQP